MARLAKEPQIVRRTASSATFPFLAALALTLAVSCGRAPTGPDPLRANEVLPILIDYSQDWSPDGSMIAFRRPYFSSYGPPGIYIASPLGTPPRWLADADLFWPSQLRFSPDSRKLVGVEGLRLVIIDVATGQKSYPINTNSFIQSPVWSPDGDSIIYMRASLDYDPPPDSSFLHSFHVRDGTDRPLLLGNAHVAAGFLGFLPDGRVSMVERAMVGHDRLVTIDFVAQRLTVIYDTGRFQDYNNVRPLVRLDGATSSLIFHMRVSPGGYWIVGLDGSPPRRFGRLWGAYDAPSPDGSQFVTTGVDPCNGTGILDLQNIDDFSGASKRHLTLFDPPQASPVPNSATALARIILLGARR